MKNELCICYKIKFLIAWCADEFPKSWLIIVNSTTRALIFTAALSKHTGTLFSMPNHSWTKCRMFFFTQLSLCSSVFKWAFLFFLDNICVPTVSQITKTRCCVILPTVKMSKFKLSTPKCRHHYIIALPNPNLTYLHTSWLSRNTFSVLLCFQQVKFPLLDEGYLDTEKTTKCRQDHF
jgi:hypothetical protein